MNELPLINIGRRLYHNRFDENLNDVLSKHAPVGAFLIKKGFYFEIGRTERLLCYPCRIFEAKDVGELPLSYSGQSVDNLINETQLMFNAGWDNPDKYGNIK